MAFLLTDGYLLCTHGYCRSSAAASARCGELISAEISTERFIFGESREKRGGREGEGGERERGERGRGGREGEGGER
jgi:hypothetical protein